MIDYLFDGVPAHDPAGRWDLLAVSDVSTSVTVRTVNSEIPGVDGSTDPAAPLQTPQLALAFHIAADDDDDRVMETRYRALVGLLANAKTISRDVDGRVSSARMELQSVTKPQHWPGSGIVQVTALIRLPGVYWRATAPDWQKASAVSATEYTVDTLAGGTAPVSDAMFRVDGPITNPVLTALDGTWARLSVTLAQGESAILDAATFRVFTGAGASFDTPGTPQPGALTTSGGMYAFRLIPRVTADPEVTEYPVTLTGGGTGPATGIGVRARKAWHV